MAMARSLSSLKPRLQANQARRPYAARLADTRTALLRRRLVAVRQLREIGRSSPLFLPPILLPKSSLGLESPRDNDMARTCRRSLFVSDTLP